MYKIIIDGTETTVSENSTILDAARSIGIDIPTLCFYKINQNGQNITFADSSCLVCLVKVNGRFVPACSTKVQDSMIVESETEEVRQLRTTALELLLGDHAGDCMAPCQMACPAHLNIPRMLKEIENGNWNDAIQTIRQRIALPSILGRICSRPCEKVCRRSQTDEAVSICQLKRFIADTDLGKETPFLPEPHPLTERNIAVIGAGPSGLSAAYYLTLAGYQVTLFEKESRCGGRLRKYDENDLPLDVLETEIEYILSLPISNSIDLRLEEEVDLENSDQQNQLLKNFDAVVLAFGAETAQKLKESDFGTTEAEPNNKINNLTFGSNGISIQNQTFQTNIKSFFAIGTSVRKNNMIVRSVADGREVSDAIDHYFQTVENALKKESSSKLSPAFSKPYRVRAGQLSASEISLFQSQADSSKKSEPLDAGMDEYSLEDAKNQAKRCFRCDCQKKDDCRLLKAAQQYDVHPEQWNNNRPKMKWNRGGSLVYEAGKCIKCGLCVAITQKLNEPLGLTFIGRGFDIQIQAPFNQSIEVALKKTAKLCVQACPTGALYFSDRKEK